MSFFNKAGTRPSALGILLCTVPVFTFGLGTWQVKRRTWKLNLIDELNDKLSRPPMRLPQQIKVDAIPEFAYRKVMIEGKFDHSKEILIGPKKKEGMSGYDVYTPLERPDGVSIIVNRGFVAQSRSDQSKRPDSLTTDTVSIVGFLRSQPPKNMFTLKNSPEKNQWIFPDLQELSKHMNAAPVLVDEIYDGSDFESARDAHHGVPIGRPPTIELRNMHATYAVTWYTLSLATTGMLFALRRSVLKPKPPKPSPNV